MSSARQEALDTIEADPVLTRLRAQVATRLDDDPGHDLEHCLRVAGWAMRCAPEVPKRDAVAAALLHDVVNVPKDDPRRSQASLLSADVAREMLGRLSFSTADIECIARAVEDHSYSRGATPRSPLGDAIQDADRLEALGALGLMRCISTGTRMGAAYFHAADPFARARTLDDRAYSVDHFFTKLLRLPASFRTPVGRAEAGRRAAFLRATLCQLADELGHAPPSNDGDCSPETEAVHGSA